MNQHHCLFSMVITPGKTPDKHLHRLVIGTEGLWNCLTEIYVDIKPSSGSIQVCVYECVCLGRLKDCLAPSITHTHVEITALIVVYQPPWTACWYVWFTTVKIAPICPKVTIKASVAYCKLFLISCLLHFILRQNGIVFLFLQLGMIWSRTFVF